MKRLIAKQTPSPDNIFQTLNNLKSEFESKFDENKFLELAKTDATKANSYIDSIVSSVTIEETVDKALEDYEKKLVEYDTELYSVKDFLYRFHSHISFNLAYIDYVYGDTENRKYGRIFLPYFFSCTQNFKNTICNKTFSTTDSCM